MVFTSRVTTDASFQIPHVLSLPLERGDSMHITGRLPLPVGVWKVWIWHNHPLVVGIAFSKRPCLPVQDGGSAVAGVPSPRVPILIHHMAFTSSGHSPSLCSSLPSFLNLSYQDTRSLRAATLSTWSPAGPGLEQCPGYSRPSTGEAHTPLHLRPRLTLARSSQSFRGVSCIPNPASSLASKTLTYFRWRLCTLNCWSTLIFINTE